MKDFKIKSPVDGLELACLVSEPSVGMAPKGIVQLLHGMCEHKERFIPFMEFLSSKGYVCIIHDHRGHGASVRGRQDLGFMGRGGWEALIRDAKAVNDYAHGKWPGLRLHLLGHSMGAMVARSYVKRYDASVDTLLLSGAPSDNPAKGAGKFLAAAFGILCGWHYRPDLLQKMSFGAYNKPFRDEGYANAWVCSDRKTLDEYHSDPLCSYTFTSDGFYNLMCLMQDCFSPRGWAMENPQLGVHFLSGGMDPCRVSDSAIMKAVDLMKKVGYRNTDLKIYPGMRHEILNETDKLIVWNDVLHLVA